MRETGADQRGELAAIELADVKFVRQPRRSLYSVLLGHDRIRRPPGAHPADLVEKRLLGDDVLDRLERDDGVELASPNGRAAQSACRKPRFAVPA